MRHLLEKMMTEISGLAGDFLPDDIDGKTPLEKVSIQDVLRVAAAISGSRRWDGVSDRKKTAHGKMMAKARMAGMTQEQRSESGRKAAMKRWGDRKKTA
jgi:hypothetical protein